MLNFIAIFVTIIWTWNYSFGKRLRSSYWYLVCWVYFWRTSFYDETKFYKLFRKIAFVSWQVVFPSFSGKRRHKYKIWISFFIFWSITNNIQFDRDTKWVRHKFCDGWESHRLFKIFFTKKTFWYAIEIPKCPTWSNRLLK